MESDISSHQPDRRQARIAECVAGVLVERQLKIALGEIEVFARLLEPIEAALEIRLEGLGIDLSARRQACRFVRGKFGPDLSNDRRHDLVAEHQDILQVTLVSVAPQLVAGCGVEQLGGDADAVARAQHPSR